MADVYQRALDLHREKQGKIEIISKVPVATAEDLTLAYTPGVAQPCLEIKENFENIYEYTTKGNTVAVVTNGTAVLGLGNIGAGAGLPVMEGKSLLFKEFAGVDSVPICLDTQKIDEVIKAVEWMSPTYGGINLEDIKAPECFEIENALRKSLDIPVFHDDQHGTAIVLVAALINALKIAKKKFSEIKVVINGAGAAGMGITHLMQAVGTKHVILCDTTGAIYAGRPKGMNKFKDEIAAKTNLQKEQGTLEDVLKGADVFIGVSAANCVSQDMVRSMAKDPIVMAMANPVPEILPDEAKAAGARIVATGRSDFANQVNNLLAFPGLFRGALDVRATDITMNMRIAAAKAIASIIPDDEIREDYIIVSPFHADVAPTVAREVARAAIDDGVAKKPDVSPDWVYEHTVELLAK